MFVVFRSSVLQRSAIRKRNGSVQSDLARILFRALFAGTLLAGCQTTAPPPVMEATPVAKSTPTPALPVNRVETREIRIRALLDQANRAIRYDHLTGPQPGNAQDLFNQVLALDPHNEEGLRGPEKIAERLVAKALDAANRWALVEARGLLAQARAIMPNHPSIGPTENQINLLASAKRTTHRFDAALVKEEDPTTIARLIAIGTDAKSSSCRTTIITPNDETGRLMFQKMNEAELEGHIRANIRIGNPAGIEVVCFPVAATAAAN